MRKYYANREMVLPFKVANSELYDREYMEERDFLDDLFGMILNELDGRITGATLVGNMLIGEVLDEDIVELEDYDDYDKILLENDVDELKVNYDVLFIARKREKALVKLYDCISNIRKELKGDC